MPPEAGRAAGRRGGRKGAARRTEFPSADARRRLAAGIALSVPLALALAAPPALPGQASAELVDRVVAIVNGEPVTLSEAREVIALAPGSAPAPSLGEAVERLIAARLMEREARRYPAEPPSPEEAEATFRALQERFDDPDHYRATLLRLGIREDYLRRRIERELRVDRYLDRRFGPLVQVNQREVEEYYRQVLLPDLPPGAQPPLEQVEGSIRRILAERDRNRRIAAWVEELAEAAEIVRLPLPPASSFC